MSQLINNLHQYALFTHQMLRIELPSWMWSGAWRDWQTYVWPNIRCCGDCEDGHFCTPRWKDFLLVTLIVYVKRHMLEGPDKTAIVAILWADFSSMNLEIADRVAMELDLSDIIPYITLIKVPFESDEIEHEIIEIE